MGRSSNTLFLVSSCLMVSFFFLVKEAQCLHPVMGLSTADKQLIVESHNRFRTMVTDAANMQKMAWDSELATIAQNYAEKCHPKPNINCSFESASFDSVGENLFVSSEPVNYFDAIASWYSEQHDYDYSLGLCNGVCSHYTQVVWAASTSIGCGAHTCLMNSEPTQFIFVCNYGPGGNIGGKLPYLEGHRCSECLKDQKCDMGLCAYTETDYSILPDSSTHHFALQLADGHFLCHTIWAESNTTYNLLSTDKLEINAKLIPDQHGRKTNWLGTIGISALHESQQKIIKIKFLIKEHLVDISDKVTLDAYSVEKLTIDHEGKLVLLPFVGKLNASKDATVRVELKDLDLNFTVRFVKHHHLDVFWENRGTGNRVEGLIGQYLHNTVKIDEHHQLLHLPNIADPIPVQPTSMWSFRESWKSLSTTTNTTSNKEKKEQPDCWAIPHSNSVSGQGGGAVQGSFLEYKVKDIFSAGFEFKMNTNDTSI